MCIKFVISQNSKIVFSSSPYGGRPSTQRNQNSGNSSGGRLAMDEHQTSAIKRLGLPVSGNSIGGSDH